MTAERWRSVPGFPGYEASDHGRIVSRRRASPVVLKPRRMPNGYLTVALTGPDGHPRTMTVHRVVMLAFVGERPAGRETRHLDGDPANNRLTNLAWGTKAKNMADLLEHGHHWQKNKAQCRQGHAYDEANTGHHKDGRRYCRACRRDSSARYRERAASV